MNHIHYTLSNIGNESIYLNIHIHIWRITGNFYPNNTTYFLDTIEVETTHRIKFNDVRNFHYMYKVCICENASPFFRRVLGGIVHEPEILHIMREACAYVCSRAYPFLWAQMTIPRDLGNDCIIEYGRHISHEILKIASFYRMMHAK